MLAIENHLGQLKKLCDMHCVDKMYLFGSALGPEFSEHSDIDFLVEFKTIDLAHYFENYLSFKKVYKIYWGVRMIC